MTRFLLQNVTLHVNIKTVLYPIRFQRVMFTGLREPSVHSSSSQEQEPLARTIHATYACGCLSYFIFLGVSRKGLQARFILFCQPASSCCFSLLVLSVGKGISSPSRKLLL